MPRKTNDKHFESKMESEVDKDLFSRILANIDEFIRVSYFQDWKSQFKSLLWPWLRDQTLPQEILKSETMRKSYNDVLSTILGYNRVLVFRNGQMPDKDNIVENCVYLGINEQTEDDGIVIFWCEVGNKKEKKLRNSQIKDILLSKLPAGGSIQLDNETVAILLPLIINSEDGCADINIWPGLSLAELTKKIKIFFSKDALSALTCEFITDPFVVKLNAWLDVYSPN